MAMSLTSPVLSNGGIIPKLYTCQGKNISPPLEWTNLPSGTESLALIMDDPDAAGGTWTHWIMYNMAADSAGIPQNAQAGQLPKGTLEGLNSWTKTGYGAPCPPNGEHRYIIKLYALDTKLDDMRYPRADVLTAAMEGHILGEADLMGRYEKHD